jgi:glycerol kinase
LAELAIGFWGSMEEIQEQWQMESVFHSRMEEEERLGLQEGWKKAINAAMSW